MTATILEPTVVETTEPVEDDFGHIVCHCSGLNVAWCGIDVTGHIVHAEELTEDEACPLCVLAQDLFDGVCPWGCACSSLERHFYCGYYEEE